MSTMRFHPALRVVTAAEQSAERGKVLVLRRPGRVIETRGVGRCPLCWRTLLNGLCPKCSRPAA